jgi:hypothetical protein
MTADKPQAGHGQLLLAAENRVTPGPYHLMENPPNTELRSKSYFM